MIVIAVAVVAQARPGCDYFYLFVVRVLCMSSVVTCSCCVVAWTRLPLFVVHVVHVRGRDLLLLQLRSGRDYLYLFVVHVQRCELQLQRLRMILRSLLLN